jgi:hypothetical protein
MGGWCWSLTLSDCWRKGEEYEWKEAQCDRGHSPPGERCTCGIYAHYEPSMLGPARPINALTSGQIDTATGVIIADGGIVPYDTGFRAQYAKIAAIFDPGEAIEALATPEEIAEHYHCDIIKPEEYDWFCIKHDLRRLDWESGEE